MIRRLPVLWLLAAGCSATGEPSPAPAEPARPVAPPFVMPADASSAPLEPAAPRELVLIAGDVIHLSVYQQPDLTLEARIPHEGAVSFPLVGPVQAAGRSPAELERLLREKLARDYLHDPQVTVTVREYARRRLYVLGAVQSPGAFDLPAMERLTLLQAVAAAGGYTDRAFKEYAHIARRKADGTREVLRRSLADIERQVARGNAAADPELWPDDLVVIPSAARIVYVMGAVRNPGSFEVPTDTPMTVSMAVSRAGSYTKFAALGRVQVLRHTPDGESQRIEVDLDTVLQGKLDKDVELRPGDVVFVPERGLF
jgi:polysaccharide export outer membrane protein